VDWSGCSGDVILNKECGGRSVEVTFDVCNTIR